MKLKTAILAVLTACCLCVTAFGNDMFAIKSVLGSPEASAGCSISTVAGEVLSFSAADLERRLGLPEGGLGGITITALPTSVQGGLFLDGVEVVRYDFLDRQEIDRLCFVPGDTATSAAITFLPQSHDAVATHLAIQILSSPNEAPVIHDGELYTVRGVAKMGQVSAFDPEGGAVAIQVITPPGKGAVTFNGLSFRYQPYQGATGEDSFTVCAVDGSSAYSREAVIRVHIEEGAAGFYYVDMATNPSAYAAIKLHENNVLTGKCIGGRYFFYPGDMTTRGDFLVMLLASCGAELQPTVNTGLPNDGALPMWLKPYVAAAIRENIVPADAAFAYNEIPTRAEAVVLTDRAAKINDVKDYALGMNDRDRIPDWAVPSYKDLAAYQMLDLHDNYAVPDGALTNSYAADLIWQLYKHWHR